jgi:hypothetical protein
MVRGRYFGPELGIPTSPVLDKTEAKLFRLTGPAKGGKDQRADRPSPPSRGRGAGSGEAG